MISLDNEHKLIGDIYDAALEPQLWPQVLKQIAEHWDARYVNIVAGDQLNPNSHIVYSHGTTEAQQQLFIEGGFAKPDMELALKWIDRGAAIGTAAANHQLFGSIENFVETAGDLYTNFYAKVGAMYQLGAMLEHSDFRYASIGFSRSEEQGGFADAQVVNAQRLIPHLRRALQIHRQLVHVREQNEQLYHMLDSMVAGVLLLDVNGRVRYANLSAENLLSKNSALSSSARYGLKAANTEQWAQLDMLIKGAIKTGVRERNYLQADERLVGGVMGLTGKRGDRPLMLTITPLSEMSGYENLASDSIAAAIFITDPHAPRVLAKRLLQENYLLNDRECDVCEAFLNCASLEGVAEMLGLSMNTVRGYSKDIYGKTRQHSQAELMKLLMGLTLEFEHIR